MYSGRVSSGLNFSHRLSHSMEHLISEAFNFLSSLIRAVYRLLLPTLPSQLVQRHGGLHLKGSFWGNYE